MSSRLRIEASIVRDEKSESSSRGEQKERIIRRAARLVNREPIGATMGSMRQRTAGDPGGAALLLSPSVTRSSCGSCATGRRPAGRSAEPEQVAEERAPFDRTRGWQAVPADAAIRVGRVGPCGRRGAVSFWRSRRPHPGGPRAGLGPAPAAPFAGRISYSQCSRFFFWRTKDGSLDRGTIVSHTANTHVIPATARLRRAIRCVSKGDDVRLEGWLVDVEGIDDPGFRWGTSTTREDEGPSSCETVYLSG